MTAPTLTWGCGCQQNPLRPVGEFTFRCDRHPISLHYCPLCDVSVTRWDWEPLHGFTFQPCGHSHGQMIVRPTTGSVPL